MKRIICALLISAAAGFSSNSPAAATDVKTAAFYAQGQIVEVEIFTSQWDNLKNQEPKGGLCVFGFMGEEYDWFHFEELRINGVAFQDAGAKKRAWCGSESQTKPSMHIKLDKFDSAQGKVARDSIGASNLLLNNSIQDRTYTRQCLAYQMWAKAGIASPLCNFAHVRVNGKDMGIYVNVQPMKKPFIQSHFGEEFGNLYEIAGEDFESWARDRLRASLDSMKKAEDRSLNDIDGVIDAVSDDTGSMEKIEKRVDLDQFFRYWAMEIILTHFDGFNLSNNNAYLYFPENGRMQILPWGPDTVLSRTNDREARQIYSENRLTLKLMESQAMHQRLLNTINEQVRLLWNESHLVGEVDKTVNAIERFIPGSELSGFHEDVEGLKRNVRLRRQQIESFSSAEFGEMFDVRLQNTKGKRFCLNAESSGDKTVANVWSCGDKPDQRWDVVRAEGGHVRLRNANSNTCVIVNGDKEHTEVGSRTCDQRSGQSWQAIFNRGAWLFESQTAPGKCLSLNLEADSSQTVVRKCDRNDPAQNWRHF